VLHLVYLKFAVKSATRVVQRKFPASPLANPLSSDWPRNQMTSCPNASFSTGVAGNNKRFAAQIARLTPLSVRRRCLCRYVRHIVHARGHNVATCRFETLIDLPVAEAWRALRQFGAADRLFAPVITHCALEGDIRTVTFGNGAIVRERLVTCDDGTRRLVYCVVGGSFEFHSSSLQAEPESDGRCRVVWLTDFLPGTRGEVVGPLVEQGGRSLKRNLESAACG